MSLISKSARVLANHRRDNRACPELMQNSGWSIGALEQVLHLLE